MNADEPAAPTGPLADVAALWVERRQLHAEIAGLRAEIEAMRLRLERAEGAAAGYRAVVDAASDPRHPLRQALPMLAQRRPHGRA